MLQEKSLRYKMRLHVMKTHESIPPVWPEHPTQKAAGVQKNTSDPHAGKST